MRSRDASRRTAQANLLWETVDEPNPALSDPGRIYLWLDVGAAAPRAYSLPYSRPLQERLQRALRAIRRRPPVQVTRAPRTPTGRKGARGTRQSSVRFGPGRAALLPPKQDGAVATP